MEGIYRHFLKAFNGKNTAIMVFAALCFFARYTESSEDHVRLSEIKITGETSTDEYIEIYNPSGSQIDISGWKILKWTRTNTSTETAKIIHTFATGTSILSEHFFLITHSGYTLSTLAKSDAIYSDTESLAEDNTVALVDNSGTIIDLLGYGNATAFEGTSPSIAPTAAKSLQRNEANSFADTNDNALDWTRGDPNPRNSNYTANTPPSATIARVSAPSEAKISDIIIFSAASSTNSNGTIISFVWNFGDGQSAEGETVSHAYNASGTYTVTLTVTDDTSQSSSTTHTLTVRAETTENIASSTLRLSEIYPNPKTGENEWIEVQNMTGGDISLTGWILLDAAAASSTAQNSIAHSTGTVPAYGFFAIALSGSILNNSGDTVQLFSPEKILTDKMQYGNGHAPIPDKEQSLARISTAEDTDADADFFLTSSTTPNAANIISINNQTETQNTEIPSSGNTTGQSVFVPIGTVRINEIVMDPKDGEVEYVEIYNTGSGAISIEGWYIEEGSEARTILTGTIPGFGFLAIDSPKGSLNNNGDFVGLYTKESSPMDTISYGSWVDVNTADNAPIAPDPYSIIRFPDGIHNGSDALSWFVTKTPTKGSKNVRSIFTEEITKVISSPNGFETIRISEIFPNPAGDDSEKEFIELWNSGNQVIDLAGIILRDNSKTSYTFPPNTLIQAGEYRAFFRKETHLSLNNTGGDGAFLETKDGLWITELSYTSAAEEGESYARTTSTETRWTTSPTPNNINIFTKKNTAPTIDIRIDNYGTKNQPLTFDASDSSDSDGDTISAVWDLGDGTASTKLATTHSYKTNGIFFGTLIITDSTGSAASTTFRVTIGKNTNDVRISEIVPNPEGDDVQEFIELYNAAAEDTDITGWKIDDGPGGSTPYIFPNRTILLPNSFTAFYKTDTHISLNNDADSARLLSPNQEIIHAVSYEDVIEGSAYAMLSNGNFAWVSPPTPNSTNSQERQKTNTKTTKVVLGKKIKKFTDIPLSSIYQSDVGDAVRTTGTIAVLPGVFGAQIFYITGSPGVQIYMYNKNFPQLAIGDTVEVRGEIGQTQGEYRIKIAQADDVHIIGHQTPPKPYEITMSDIAEHRAGTLISVQGDITEKRSNYFYLDDGAGEVQVLIKKNTGIPLQTFAVGDTANVIGILSNTKDGIALLPRSRSDITLLPKEKPTKQTVFSAQKYAASPSMLFIVTTILFIMYTWYSRKKKKINTEK